MQKLADYIGLPCRIARGCKYCVADHRSSCLVKIEDNQLVREYVVDLVGKPGNDGGLCSQIINSKHTRPPPEDPLYPAYGGESQVLKESSLLPVDQTRFGMEAPLMPLELKVNAENCLLQTPMPSCVQGDISEAVDVGAAMASLEECAGLGDKSSQSDLEEVDSKLEIQSRFSCCHSSEVLNLEPSLAMDWLEISWDDLHIKERVGAGSFGTVHRAEWNGSDVAVKVLTVQDFHDDQLREFFKREVAIMKRVRHPNSIYLGVVFIASYTGQPQGNFWIIGGGCAWRWMWPRGSITSIVLTLLSSIGILNLQICWLIKIGQRRYAILGCPDSKQTLYIIEVCCWNTRVDGSGVPSWRALK
ncbi:hypothetical protein M0R45_027270 [Rubus argutus]|uniref:non-specific serine/threonine protein kinase n=1 Tax=Rubus argutus TaxID=59490 RepID=A0AAW1X2N2_RUBAR